MDNLTLPPKNLKNNTSQTSVGRSSSYLTINISVLSVVMVYPMTYYTDIYQGFIYLQNVILFSGIRLDVPLFIPLRKARPSRRRFSGHSLMHNSIMCRSGILDVMQVG
jgi:hypothetical protein